MQILCVGLRNQIEELRNFYVYVFSSKRIFISIQIIKFDSDAQGRYMYFLNRLNTCEELIVFDKLNNIRMLGFIRKMIEYKIQ